MVIGLGALAFWPALGSQFIGDDWGFLTLSRHLDWPWALYYYDHSSSYFYRPNTMLLWWLSVAVLGLHPALHMALNLSLHLVNALLLGRIVGSTTRRFWLGIGAAALFALHPITIGTSFWLADRFDLLATAAVFWAVLALEGALAGTSLLRWVFVAALLAAGAKETAIVLPAMIAARLLLATGRTWGWRGKVLLGVSAPFALALLVRAQLVSGVGDTLNISDLFATAMQGVSNWLAFAPRALAGIPSETRIDLVIVAGFLAAIPACWLWLRPRYAPGSAALALVGVTCAIAPALVQWPVTQSALAAPNSLANPVNLRFFYLSLGGLLMLTAATLSTVNGRRAMAALGVAAIAAGILWLPASRERARHWVAETTGPGHPISVAAGRLAAGLQVQTGCRLHLLGTVPLTPNFVRYADVIVKGQSPRGSTLLDCIVLGELSPWFSITREVPCTNAAWAPLRPSGSPGHVNAPRRVSNLCYHFFADPPPREAWNDPQSRWFQFDGESFRELPRQ